MLRVTGVSSGSSSARLLSVPCRALYQFPPLCSSVAGILLRISCIFVADGAKTELQGEDLLEVEPLVRRVRGMVLRVSSCALFIVLPRTKSQFQI